MGISSAEIGSLSYEEIMAYAKDGQLVNDTVNEKSTAELIFTNTSQEHDCRDLQTAIYQTSTNNIFTKQEETIEQEPSYTPFYAVAAGSSTSQFQTSNAINNNNIIINNNSSIMYQDIPEDWGRSFSPSNFDLFSDNDIKLNDCEQATCDQSGIDNTHNLVEETYEFVSGDGDNNTILTLTQEIIDAGISSEDLHLHKNTQYDEKSTSNTIDEFNNDFQNYNDFKLEDDPMMSIDITQLTSTVQSNENVIVFKESEEEYITLDESKYLAFIKKAEVSFESSSPDFRNNRINNSNNSNRFKPVQNKESAVCNSAKSTKLAKLKLSQIIVPEQVNTAEVLDNAVSLLESEELKNRNTKFITVATSSTSSTILDISNNTTCDYSFVDDVTQSSLLSPVSKYDYSAPPTPYSSFEFNPERKRRGRPPKTHSTLPDQEELDRLNPSDRKYRLQRCKNNEASRQSRLNRKRKQDKNCEEEEKLDKDHAKLTYEHDKWLRIETKLKAMLQKHVHKTE